MAFYNGPEPISSRHMAYFNCVRRLSSQKNHNENYNIGPLAHRVEKLDYWPKLRLG
jgi:hypothetical protein